MKKYSVKIKGISPLVWHRMKKEIEDEKVGLKKDQMKEWEPNPKNWLRYAEYKSNGEKYPKQKDKVFVPATWLHGTLVGSAKHSKMVPHFATSKKETYTRYVGNLKFISDNSICLIKDLKPFGRYEPSRGKMGGGKIWKVNPMLEKWSCKFTIYDFFGRMQIDELEELLIFSGGIEGIGSCRIRGFGRFELKSLKEED